MSLDIVLLLFPGMIKLAPAALKESFMTTFYYCYYPARYSLCFRLVNVYWPANASFELQVVPATPELPALGGSFFSIEFTFCLASSFDLREIIPVPF